MISFFQNLEGQDSCVICPEGYYCPENSTDYSDKPCPAGHYCLSGTQSDTQYPCSMGTFNNATGMYGYFKEFDIAIILSFHWAVRKVRLMLMKLKGLLLDIEISTVFHHTMKAHLGFLLTLNYSLCLPMKAQSGFSLTLH